MKYRIIQRNDGLFQYEHSFADHRTYGEKKWFRLNHVSFKSEAEARSRLNEIIEFSQAANIKRVVEEIEI